jgi:hypothetical protein
MSFGAPIRLSKAECRRDRDDPGSLSAFGDDEVAQLEITVVERGRERNRGRAAVEV